MTHQVPRSDARSSHGPDHRFGERGGSPALLPARASRARRPATQQHLPADARAGVGATVDRLRTATVSLKVLAADRCGYDGVKSPNFTDVLPLPTARYTQICVPVSLVFLPYPCDTSFKTFAAATLAQSSRSTGGSSPTSRFERVSRTPSSTSFTALIGIATCFLPHR